MILLCIEKETCRYCFRNMAYFLLLKEPVKRIRLQHQWIRNLKFSWKPHTQTKNLHCKIILHEYNY